MYIVNYDAWGSASHINFAGLPCFHLCISRYLRLSNFRLQLRRDVLLVFEGNCHKFRVAPSRHYLIVLVDEVS